MNKKSFHLAAVVSQDLVDQIFKDAIPPSYDIINKHYPFPDRIAETPPLAPGSLPDMIAWALSKQSTGSEEDLFRSEFLGYYELAKSDLDEVANSYAEFEKATDKDKPVWDGPSNKELEEWSAFGWDTKAHLAWLHVWVPTRPSIQIQVPITLVNDLRVSAGATGEWWVRRPKLKCIRKWHGICYSWKVIWVWERWGSITVDSITVKSEISVQWTVRHLNVEGTAKFEKLRLDYKILELIPIERWVDPITFRAIDAQDLVGVLPILASKYAVSKVALPAGNELRLEVVLAKT